MSSEFTELYIPLPELEHIVSLQARSGVDVMIVPRHSRVEGLSWVLAEQRNDFEQQAWQQWYSNNEQ